MAEKIIVTVENLEGTCRFWKHGDKFVLLRSRKTRMLGIDHQSSDSRGACLAGLMSIYPFVLGALDSWDGRTTCHRFRCPDPGENNAGRGSVIFKVEFTGKDERVEGVDEEPIPDPGC